MTTYDLDNETETALLAGGCFWGMEDLLREKEGVLATRVGYTGGTNEYPTYRNHPGHAEAVEIVFDPDEVSFRDLLELFLQVHDPTTLDRQGNDVGTSYRSAIFYNSRAQRDVAVALIKEIDESGRWPGKVVTDVTPAGVFWEAEPEHQDYLVKNPNGYTCHYLRPSWRLSEQDPVTT